MDYFVPDIYIVFKSHTDVDNFEWFQACLCDEMEIKHVRNGC